MIRTLSLVGLLLALAGGAVAHAEGEACDCDADVFEDEVGRAERTFNERGAGVRLPLTQAAHDRFAARVEEAYQLAECLTACTDVASGAQNQARRILAATAYKSRDIGVDDDEIQRRLTRAKAEMERCVASEPKDPECITWHASARGRLAQYSWSPLLVRLPGSLLEAFRTARGDLPPGQDLRDGAATRGEVSLLLRAPRLLGGDTARARELIEAAARAPRFACAVGNRRLLAETRTRTGDAERGLAELRAAVAAGLPDCALQRYENASGFEEMARCLRRIEADPTLKDQWPDACS